MLLLPLIVPSEHHHRLRLLEPCRPVLLILTAHHRLLRPLRRLLQLRRLRRRLQLVALMCLLTYSCRRCLQFRLLWLPCCPALRLTRLHLRLLSM